MAALRRLGNEPPPRAKELWTRQEITNFEHEFVKQRRLPRVEAATKPGEYVSRIDVIPQLRAAVGEHRSTSEIVEFYGRWKLDSRVYYDECAKDVAGCFQVRIECAATRRGLSGAIKGAAPENFGSMKF